MWRVGLGVYGPVSEIKILSIQNVKLRGKGWASKVGHDLATKRQEQQPGTERDAYGIWMRAAQSRFTDFLLVLRAILMWINIHCSHFVGEVTEALGDD